MKLGVLARRPEDLCHNLQHVVSDLIGPQSQPADLIVHDQPQGTSPRRTWAEGTD